MRIGLVKGDFFVLTKQQFKELLQWKKDNRLNEVYIEVAKEYQSAMEVYVKPYRHLYLGTTDEYDKLLEFKQDQELLDGKLDNYPLRVRCQIITTTDLAEKVAISLVNPKRVNHILSVTKLAKELANSHHIDVNKTSIAGLFHDSTKNWPLERSLFYMKRYYPLAVSRHPNVYHQYTAEKFLEKYLGITDKDILKAIRHHVDGDDDNPISQIIYLSDKLDPSRGYDSSELIEIAKKNLDEAVKIERRIQIEYLKKEGREVS